MPYNTRRKSLSLPSLGIHVPVTHAARDAARAAAANNRHSPTSQSTSSSRSSSRSQSHSASSSTCSASSTTLSYCSPRSSSSPIDVMDAQTRTLKNIKRSHGGDDAPAAKRHRANANTPPPSPPHSRAVSVEMKDADDLAPGKIDMSTIKDEIVEAVIVQLQSTGNRPHIVKELANVLMLQLRIVQQSANPAAIISSRLSTYLKRPCWNANNPCPLAKELETVHPRRTYFYLTTCPHQSLPDPTMAALAAAHRRAIITPSVTSGSDDADDADDARRRELSPSPEVDLSSPEFDDMDDDIPMPSTPIGSYPGRHNSILVVALQSQAGAEPPLEKDEKEFTDTATELRKTADELRKPSGEAAIVKSEAAGQNMEMDEHKDEHRDEVLFFGEPKPMATTSHAPPMAFIMSPETRPTFSVNLKKEAEIVSFAKLDSLLEWERSPEMIELDELDGMLDDY